MEHPIGRGSDFVPGMRFNAFSIYDRERRETSLAEFFRHLKPGETGDTEVFYSHKREYKPVRICVLSKTKEREEAAVKRMGRTRRRKNPWEAGGS